MRNILSLVVVFFVGLIVNAQELNCTLNINSDKIAGSNKQVYETLENELNDFINQTRWTDYNYKNQERVNCNITITINEQTGNNFKGNVQIQASRPVYGSNYSTPVFNFKDSNFSFQYTEFEPLQYNETAFESNLVSMMTFYVYTVLGMDADTFSLYGGLPFFKKAQDIVVQAQQGGFAGWNQTDGRQTRFSLIDNILSPTYKMFHQSMYDYHLNGLDVMSQNQRAAKEEIATAILTLKQVHDNRPAAFLIRVFMDSKADEIADIFSDGPRVDTSKMVDALQKMSPLNSEKWNQIK